MNYELALKLKKAGFPQHWDSMMSANEIRTYKPVQAYTLKRTLGEHRTFDYSIYPIPVPDDFSQGKARVSSIFSREFLDSDEGKKYTVYFPTLEELIEACGQNILQLVQRSPTVNPFWEAYQGPVHGGHGVVGTGNTPTEAVAHLWLSLNSKA